MICVSHPPFNQGISFAILANASSSFNLPKWSSRRQLSYRHRCVLLSGDDKNEWQLTSTGRNSFQIDNLKYQASAPRQKFCRSFRNKYFSYYKYGKHLCWLVPRRDYGQATRNHTLIYRVYCTWTITAATTEYGSGVDTLKFYNEKKE